MSTLNMIALVVIPTSIIVTVCFMYMYYREWVKSRK